MMVFAASSMGTALLLRTSATRGTARPAVLLVAASAGTPAPSHSRTPIIAHAPCTAVPFEEATGVPTLGEGWPAILHGASTISRRSVTEMTPPRSGLERGQLLVEPHDHARRRAQEVGEQRDLDRGVRRAHAIEGVERQHRALD